MDFIAKQGSKIPFVNDKSLWVNALQRKPGYDHLLGWDNIMNQLGKNDTEEQAEARIKYSSRAQYVNYQMSLGKARGPALADWAALWHGNQNIPPNFMMGAVDNQVWDTGPNIDFYGYVRNAGQYVSQNIPAFYYRRQWLTANPNYRAVGWRNNPNNPIIRRFYPAPGGGAGGGGAGGAGGAGGGGGAVVPAGGAGALALPGGGIVPPLPAVGIYG